MKEFLKEEEIVEYPNGWNPLSSKPQMRNIKDWHNKKREVRKEEAPVASTCKPQDSQPPQERKKNKKKNWRQPYVLSFRITRIESIPWKISLSWPDI
ncbi:hypothetical protein O181_027672 [Austropuccinia psidii MF-1]|uniref:Uncharacterized protein n=1 Tax=Austropuccinia psidii MF-1 TaxID=1389203 RepID=A0A9Q3CQG0_9BASI|nr:hypothetical protein [Austropuccinia psidii MF-1]